MASRDDGEIDEREFARTAQLVGEQILGTRDGSGRSIGVACAKFNGDITLRLLDGVLAGLSELSVARRDIIVAWVPGAFELPLMARALATKPDPVDAVIAIGAVIRGDTSHYDFVAGECARGLQDVQLQTGVPVAFGVLTTENRDQALDRSRDDDTNKGRESAITVVEMVSALRSGSLTQ
jgi:6,7-dimethyl-8-ribityllumazine synthase